MSLGLEWLVGVGTTRIVVITPVVGMTMVLRFRVVLVVMVAMSAFMALLLALLVVLVLRQRVVGQIKR